MDYNIVKYSQIVSSQDRERVFSEIIASSSTNNEEEFAEVYWHDDLKCLRVRIFKSHDNDYWDFNAHELLNMLVKCIFDLQQ